MMGTTKQTSGAAAAENALSALTAERDAALAEVATITAERAAAGESADAVIRKMIEHDFQPATEGEWDVDERTIELLEQFANARSMLAAALVAQGWLGEGDDIDPVQRALDVIAWHAGLQAGLASIGKRIAELDLQPAGDEQPLLNVIETLIVRVPELAVERDQAVADLVAATKAHDKTKGQLKTARAAAAPKPAKLRAIGPVEKQPVGEGLLAAIAAAETVELVYSDGARELGALPSQLIQGDAWHLATNGVKLRIATLPVHGPGHGEPAVRLAGFGLLLDGEQVAWAARMDPLTVQAGSLHELKDDVIFA